MKLKCSEAKWQVIAQIIKFAIVGMVNNLIYYVVYVVCEYLGMHYLVGNLLGFSVSIFNAHYWNNKYVFKTSQKRDWWKALVRTYISYASTGIVVSGLLLYLFVDVVGIPHLIAPIICLVITVPVNFIINKKWAYKDKNE